ncbi:MAG: hypothetical protein C0399_07875 [Syntrophus sp. (in: bacteria)]|nr:hypothetical protein [Syntrophus sp. (in: bacteria)]
MESMKKYIMENWKLKLLSLGLAIALWFIVFSIGEMKKEVSVPVFVTNLSKDYVVMKKDTEKIDITIQGRVSVLKDVKDNDIKASLNLSDVKEGENIYSITKSNIQIPKGVQIGQIRPTAIKVDIDRVIEKRVKIIVKLDRKWIGKYGVKSWNPAYVTVEGPKQIWETRMFLDTRPINGVLKRDEEIVTVLFDLEGLPASKIKPDSVTVILRRQSGKETSWN